MDKNEETESADSREGYWGLAYGLPYAKQLIVEMEARS